MKGQGGRSTLRHQTAEVGDAPQPAHVEAGTASSSGRETPRGDLFRVLVQSVRDYAIFMLDPDGYVRTWNEGAHRIKGYDADEIIGKHFSIFYPPREVRRGKPEYMLRVAIDEGHSGEEGWRVRKDGSQFWASVVITALHDDEGRLVGFTKVTRDLSERKQAEEERSRLLAMEREARSATEAALERLNAIQGMTEAVLTSLSLEEVLGTLLDRIMDSLVVDTAAVHLLDSGSNELVARTTRGLEEGVEQGARIPVGKGFAGRIAAERRAVFVDDVDESDALDPLLMEKGVRSLLGVPLLLQGQLIGVLQVGTLRHRRFTDSDGQFLQIAGDRVALAIEHVRLFDAALQAQREVEIADAAVRARDEFLSVAAHELKTPMTSLRIAAQLLLRRLSRGVTPDPDTLRHGLHTIDRQTSKLARLVTQLLETVRLEAERVEIQRMPTNLTELVSGLVEGAQAQTDRHDIVLTAPGPVWAQVDPVRFDQVVTNLLDNAIKFSPAGGRIDVKIDVEEPGPVRITVRDFGLGVPPEHRPHLFERFYQAHGDDYRSGMGLGLYISREIVTMHGGRMTVEFPEDGGTRFVVNLPAEPQPGDSATTFPEPAGPGVAPA